MSDLAAFRRNIQRNIRRGKVPLFLETRGSIWPSTRIPILAFALYAFGIWLLNGRGLAPNFGRGASSLSSLLSMIVGLMISYRSGSSSERWHEGRRIWASLTGSLRVLITTLHLSLSPPAVSEARAAQQQSAVDELLQLCVAYSYALKNHLRDADSLTDVEFRKLLPLALLNNFDATPPMDRKVSGLLDSQDEEKFERVLNCDTATSTQARQVQSKSTRLGAPRNMPLYLLRQIQTILNRFHTTQAPSAGAPQGDSPLLETPTWATCLGIIKEMTDQLSQAERIRDTPIPIALGIHVQQMLLLYCLSIPPQLVELLGLWVVPVSAVVAWTFWGVDSAAAQLSDPFGTDSNDLPIDRFVQNIHSDYLDVIGKGGLTNSAPQEERLTLPAGSQKTAKSQ